MQRKRSQIRPSPAKIAKAVIDMVMIAITTEDKSGMKAIGTKAKMATNMWLLKILKIAKVITQIWQTNKMSGGYLARPVPQAAQKQADFLANEKILIVIKAL